MSTHDYMLQVPCSRVERNLPFGVGARCITVAVGLLITVSNNVAAEPFTLSLTEMDRVTAGSDAIIADSTAFAMGNSEPSLADTLADTTVSPTSGSAFAGALGASLDGATADGSVDMVGAIEPITQATDGFASTITTGEAVAVVEIEAQMTFEADQATLGTTAFGSGDETFASTSAALSETSDTADISAGGFSDSLSLSGGAAFSSVSGTVGENGTMVTAAGTGDELAGTTTGISGLVATEQALASVDGASDAAGLGEGAASESSTILFAGGNELVSRIQISSTAAAAGEGVSPAEAETSIDIIATNPGAAVIEMTTGDNATLALGGGATTDAMSKTSIFVFDPSVAQPATNAFANFMAGIQALSQP